jgi:acetyltransferase
MSTYRLDKVFAPRSVAVIGASPREKSPGRAVLKNLHGGGFTGEIGLVNPHYDAIEGVRAVKSFDALPAVPDLVVIAAPPPAVPALVATAGQRGTAAAIVLTNAAMLDMCRNLGFQVKADPEEPSLVVVTLPL